MGVQCQTSLISVNSVTGEKKNLYQFPYELIERISPKKSLGSKLTVQMLHDS